MKLRPLAQPYLVPKVSSGCSALFWHDNWTGLGPLIDLTGEFGPRITGLPYMAKLLQSGELVDIRKKTSDSITT